MLTFFYALFTGEGAVNFSNAHFTGDGSVYFNGSRFSKEGNTDFFDTVFSGITHFIDCRFKTNVFFSYVDFMSPNEVRFDTEDLSNVSFLNTDITKIVFHENARFGKLKPASERF
jgi:hypothetical protein